MLDQVTKSMYMKLEKLHVSFLPSLLAFPFLSFPLLFSCFGFLAPYVRGLSSGSSVSRTNTINLHFNGSFEGKSCP